MPPRRAAHPRTPCRRSRRRPRRGSPSSVFARLRVDERTSCLPHEVAGDDPAVSSVRAAAAHDRPASAPGKSSERNPGGLAARSLHQLGRVVTRLGDAHLLRGVERLESGIGCNGDGLRELARVRHREVDLTHTASLRDRGEAAREVHGRLRPADDLDLLPGEGACDAEAERLADGLLAGETPRIALGGIRPRRRSTPARPR